MTTVLIHFLALWLILAVQPNRTDVRLPNGRVLTVEVASTPDAVGRGLAGRQSVPADSGILLVYPGDVRTNYNLFGYPVPMDILYIDENKTIINFRQNLAPCRNLDCGGYDSIWMHRYALQLPAGTIKRLNLHAGDVLSFNAPSFNFKPVLK